MNRLVLDAQVIERRATRYTPAGLPAVDLTIRHESELQEDGQIRKVTVELKALGIGKLAASMDRLAIGSTATFAGFLTAARNGKGTLFHVTEFEVLNDIASSGPLA